jgi:hypothetical protein
MYLKLIFMPPSYAIFFGYTQGQLLTGYLHGIFSWAAFWVTFLAILWPDDFLRSLKYLILQKKFPNIFCPRQFAERPTP